MMSDVACVTVASKNFWRVEEVNYTCPEFDGKHRYLGDFNDGCTFPHLDLVIASSFFRYSLYVASKMCDINKGNVNKKYML